MHWHIWLRFGPNAVTIDPVRYSQPSQAHRAGRRLMGHLKGCVESFVRRCDHVCPEPTLKAFGPRRHALAAAHERRRDRLPAQSWDETVAELAGEQDDAYARRHGPAGSGPGGRREH